MPTLKFIVKGLHHKQPIPLHKTDDEKKHRRVIVAADDNLITTDQIELALPYKDRPALNLSPIDDAEFQAMLQLLVDSMVEQTPVTVRYQGMDVIVNDERFSLNQILAIRHGTTEKHVTDADPVPPDVPLPAKKTGKKKKS